MLVHSEDVSSKTVPRKKKQTVFQRVYAGVTTSKPNRGANVAGRPWIVTFRNVSVEGQVVRARRSSHERRKSRTLCSGLSLWHYAVLFLLRVNPLRGKNDGLRTKQLKPPTPDGTAWPITPQDWERSGFGRRWERLTQHQWSFGRWRRGRSRCGGCGGPNNGTDLREHHRPCVQSRCAQVCALAALRGDQPDSASVPSGWSTKSEPANPLVKDR